MSKIDIKDGLGISKEAQITESVKDKKEEKSVSAEIEKKAGCVNKVGKYSGDCIHNAKSKTVKGDKYK